MPLFMALCGFFAKGSVHLSVRDFTFRKFKQLLLPAVIFVIISALFKNWGGVFNLCRQLFHSFWFLKSAFICYVFYYIATRINTISKKTPLGYILTIIVTQVIGVFQINIMYPCFLFGVAMQHFHPTIHKYAVKITIYSFSAFLVMLLFFDSSFWSFRSVVNYYVIPTNILSTPQYWYVTGYKLIIGMIGTLAFFNLFECIFSKSNENSKFSKMTVSIGKQTLGIYILQSYILENWLASSVNFDMIPTTMFYLLVVPFISMSVLLACSLIIRLTQYLPVAPLLLFNQPQIKAKQHNKEICLNKNPE